MNLTLTVYTDDTLTEVKRVVEAEKLKIPYRVATYIAQSLDSMNLKSEDDVLKFATGSVDKLDKIIKATFGISETELECVDVAELGTVAKDLYKWGLEKIATLKGGDSKNVQTTT